MTREELENKIRQGCEAITSTEAVVALQKVDLKMSKTSYRAWRRGEWPLGDEKLQALAKLLGYKIEVDWRLKRL